jgi:hypothetical protein
MKSTGFFSLGKVLIAAIAICAAAPSAKADLDLTFSSPNGPTTSMTVSPTASGTGLVVGNFTIDYKVSETFQNGVETLTLEITRAVNNGTSTKPGSNSLNFRLSDTDVTTPTAGTTLKNTLSGVTITGGGANQKVTNAATYTDYEGVYPNGLPTTTSTSIGGFSTPYELTTSGQISVAAVGSNTTFTSTAQVIGVPEPSAVIAAMAGLPCMGLVVGFARRRRA